MNDKSYYIEYLKRTDKFPQCLYHKAKYNMVEKMFNALPKGSLVLDAGCGVGNITGKYCELYSITGIDEQQSAVQYCQKTYNGKYIQSNLFNLPFENNKFDLILFLDTIEHLKKPVFALSELARVLKPGSNILICTINYANPLWFILENTWHRFFGGSCKTYSKDVHPTRYNSKLLREHCKGLFEEISLQKHIMNMELFYIGKKV